jgi:hypothetical protein
MDIFYLNYGFILLAKRARWVCRCYGHGKEKLEIEVCWKYALL